MTEEVKETGLATKTGYGQVVPTAHQVLPHKELVSRALTVVLELYKDFYCIEEYDPLTKQRVPVYRLYLDAKQKIGGVSGCRYDSHVVERRPDYIRAEAYVEYRTPMGELIRFPREREIAIPTDRELAIIKKLLGKLRTWTGQKGTAEQRAKAQEVNTKYLSLFTDPSKDPAIAEAEANAYLKQALLTVTDMLEINDNMLKLRQSLANVACSKALSSAYTDFMRYIGQRVVYKGGQDGKMTVTLINTIEIPKEFSKERDESPIKMLYGDDAQAEAIEDERLMAEAAAEAAEPAGAVVVTNPISQEVVDITDAVVAEAPAETPQEATQEAQEAASEPSGESAQDAEHFEVGEDPADDSTADSTDGDPAPAESEAKAEEPSAVERAYPVPTRAGIISAIQDSQQKLGWDANKMNAFIKEMFGKNLTAKDMTNEQLADINAGMLEEVAKKVNKGA
jgi:hypothetical protein